MARAMLAPHSRAPLLASSSGACAAAGRGWYDPGSDRKLVLDFTVLLTAKTMHALFGPSRRKWIAL